MQKSIKRHLVKSLDNIRIWDWFMHNILACMWCAFVKKFT